MTGVGAAVLLPVLDLADEVLLVSGQRRHEHRGRHPGTREPRPGLHQVVHVAVVERLAQADTAIYGVNSALGANTGKAIAQYLGVGTDTITRVRRPTPAR